VKAYVQEVIFKAYEEKMLNEIMLGGQDENVSDDGSKDEEEANSD